MRASRFYGLLLATLLAAGALIASILSEPRRALLPDDPMPAFPLLAEAPEEAATILVSAPKGDYRLARSVVAELWLLPEKGGYPADSRQVARLLNGLADLKLYEAKTAKPENLDLLELAGPKRGPKVKLFDAGGAPLLDAVIGKRRENLGRVGVTATYLRYSDADQAWLAIGDPVIPSSAMAMLDQSLLNLAGSLIARVSVTPPEGGEPLVALRLRRDNADLLLDPPPAFGVDSDALALRTLADGLRQLVFDDVGPVEDLAMERPWIAVFTSFDGIEVTLTFLQRDGELWARIAADAVPPPGGESQAVREDAAAFAAALAARTEGWVYRLDPLLFRRLAKRRSSVVTAPSE